MTPTSPEYSPDDLPSPACATYEAIVQAVLDRERPAADLSHEHTVGCARCRAFTAAARAFLATERSAFPEPPPGLTDRVVAGVAGDTSVRRIRRVAAGVMAAAVAASLLVLGVFIGTRPTDRERVPVAHVAPMPPPVHVGDQLADAGSALARITSRVTDRTVTPTRTLLLPPEVVTLPRAVPSPMVEPAADSLAAVPEAAQAGLEPVTATTRRAVNLFLRDFGMSPSAKPNS